MKNAERAAKPIRLTFGSTERVEVIADDKHRFHTTVSEAAHACKVANDLSLWADEYKDFLAHLHRWCDSRSGIVNGCYVSWGEGGLHVFIVTENEQFDFDFQAEITALDAKLSEVFPDHPAEVVQVPLAPPDALMSFFSPEQSVQVYGKQSTASGKG